MLRVLSLFSGIGAFEVALDEENIDWELDHYCEIDKYACRSYNCIHGTTDEDNLKDVTNIDYSKIGRVDLVTYGFPCQDISLAGNQKGFFDEEGNLTRSGLFFNAADVIRHTKPKFAIFENVKNLTGKKFKAEFETVLSVLDELGYNTYWKVLNAKDYGIPQNRERVFGISIRKDIDKGYTFPEKQELKMRLKDMLENEVDEKYYLSDEVQKRFKLTDKTLSKNIIGTTAPEFRTIGQRDSVYQVNSVMVSLVATDYKQPKQILEPKVEQVGNIVNTGNWDNPQRGRIYSVEGLSPTLNCMQGGGLEPKIVEIKNEQHEESIIIDDLYKNRELKSYTDTAPTIRAERQGLKVVEPSEKRSNLRQYGIRKDGCSNTLTTVQKDNYVVEPNSDDILTDFRIRKLTPRECWRLMGFKDEYFDRVKGVSNSQLYKQAGNSIVVDVLRAIFRELKNQYPDDFKEVWGEDL